MRRLLVPVVFLVVALAATFLIDLAQGEAVQGTPDWSRVVADPGSPFQEQVYVEWTTGDGSSGSGFVTFPDEERGAETLSLRVRDGEATIDGITWPGYVMVGVIAVLLSFVVDYSVRGYGYVRGTGQVSETPDLDVGEERGFYWRT